jgi:hypothetical protein
MSATATVEDAERGRSAQCAAGVDVFDPAAAATRRDPKRRARCRFGNDVDPR